MLMLFSMLILFSLLFFFLNHPLSFGLIILIQTTLISFITGLMNYNFWFSYILFLIMIGGMLILFIYMTSIASNEKFKFSYKILLAFILIFSLMMILLLIDNYFFYFNMNSFDLNNQNYIYENYFSLSKFFNWPNNLIVYLMMIYLFITLIVVVKITMIKYGPLRQKN